MIAVFTIALLLGQAPQEAPTPVVPAPQASAEDRRPSDPETVEADRGNQRVCRREHVVGSNRPQRVCMTRNQWARISEDARDRLNEGQRGRGEDVRGVGNVY